MALDPGLSLLKTYSEVWSNFEVEAIKLNSSLQSIFRKIFRSLQFKTHCTVRGSLSY